MGSQLSQQRFEIFYCQSYGQILLQFYRKTIFKNVFSCFFFVNHYSMCQFYTFYYFNLSYSKQSYFQINNQFSSLLDNIYLPIMCYLKNLNLQEDQELNIWNSKEEETSEPTNSDSNVLIPCFQKHMGVFWNQQQQNLVRIFELIQKNSRLISEMNKFISTNSQQVEKITINYENQTCMPLSSRKKELKNFGEDQDHQQQNNTILQKLFGSKKYIYSLQASEKFQEVIYKERNFNIGVKLVDRNNKIVRNGNLLTLCFGVCTSEAQWINQSRIGEQFMKGKTQIQLYKGQALFQKLYAREVSRIYSGGKINVVIYAKPSTLKYSNSGTNQQTINSEDIEPLIIENISIRAKRKQ